MLSFPITVNAQFPELRLNDKGTDAGREWPVTITTASDGNCIVSWSGGSRLLAPDGTPVGEELPYFGLFGGVISQGDNRWGFFAAEDTVWEVFPCEWARRTKYYFVTRNLSGIVGVSDTLFSTNEYWSHCDGPSKFQQLYKVRFAQSGDKVLVSWNSYNRNSNGYQTVSNNESGYTLWNSETIHRYVLPPGGWWKSRVELDMASSAFSESGTPFLYVRRHESELHLPRLTSYVYSSLDSETGVLDTTLVRDTLATVDCDLSDFIIPYDNGNVDVLRLRPMSDSLVVARYDRHSNEMIEIDVVPDIRRYEVLGIPQSPDCADVSHCRLSSGRHLLSWSQTDHDDKTRLYIAGFDPSWTMIGSPLRVSEANTREMIMSSVTVQNDTIAIAWLDSRDRYWGVYYKRIPLHIVVSSDQPPQPNSPALHVFPNPARHEVHFSMDTNTDATAMLYDMLGRKLRDIRVAGNGEQAPGRIGLHGISPGIYMLVVHTKDAVSTRKVIVTK